MTRLSNLSLSDLGVPAFRKGSFAVRISKPSPASGNEASDRIPGHTGEKTRGERETDVESGRCPGALLDIAIGVVVERRVRGEATHHSGGEKQPPRRRDDVGGDSQMHDRADEKGADHVHRQRAHRKATARRRLQRAGAEVARSTADGSAERDKEELQHFCSYTTDGTR